MDGFWVWSGCVWCIYLVAKFVGLLFACLVGLLCCLSVLVPLLLRENKQKLAYALELAQEELGGGIKKGQFGQK